MYDTYVSIDLETTGLNPKRDRIIEIGAIRVEQGQIAEEFSTFVDPGRKLEERITELTGIRDEDLADAPQLDEVFPQLLEFMGELPLLGHRILFDYSFLKKAAVDRKITFERSAVDTLQVARKYLPELPHRNLGIYVSIMRSRIMHTGLWRMRKPRTGCSESWQNCFIRRKPVDRHRQNPSKRKQTIICLSRSHYIFR